jgi:hypothetical protein
LLLLLALAIFGGLHYSRAAMSDIAAGSSNEVTNEFTERPSSRRPFLSFRAIYRNGDIRLPIFRNGSN